MVRVHKIYSRELSECERVKFPMVSFLFYSRELSEFKLIFLSFKGFVLSCVLNFVQNGFGEANL